MPTPAATLSRAHVGVATSFALAGFAFASWASRIPDTSAPALALGPRDLGLLLLLGSAGSVLALPLSGWVVSHLGTARTVRYGAMLACPALAVVGLAVSVLHSVAATGAALFCATFGIGSPGCRDERPGRLGRITGARSLDHAPAPRGLLLGTVAGAGVGVATAARLPIPVHLGLLAVLGLATAVWSVRAYLPDGRSSVTGATGHSVRRSLAAWTERRTLLIGLIVLVAAFAEAPPTTGWPGDGHRLRPAHLGRHARPATFLTAMTLGRAIGTVLLDRYGRARVVGVTLAMAATGAGLVWLGPSRRVCRCSAVGVGASLASGRDERGGRRPGARRGAGRRRLDDRLSRLPPVRRSSAWSASTRGARGDHHRRAGRRTRCCYSRRWAPAPAGPQPEPPRSM